MRTRLPHHFRSVLGVLCGLCGKRLQDGQSLRAHRRKMGTLRFAHPTALLFVEDGGHGPPYGRLRRRIVSP